MKKINANVVCVLCEKLLREKPIDLTFNDKMVGIKSILLLFSIQCLDANRKVERNVFVYYYMQNSKPAARSVSIIR